MIIIFMEKGDLTMNELFKKINYEEVFIDTGALHWINILKLQALLFYEQNPQMNLHHILCMIKYN